MIFARSSKLQPATLKKKKDTPLHNHANFIMSKKFTLYAIQ